MTIINAKIPELYRSVDMDGVIVDCGERYAKLLGYTIDEVIGTPFFDHTPAAGREDLKASFEAWKGAKSNVAKRIQLEAKDGKITDVILTVTNRYEDGKLVGRDAVMREVSHIKDFQDMYSVHARDNYEDPDTMRRSINYIGVIIDCNQTYLDKLGYTREEAIGTSLYEHTAVRSKGNLATNMENWRAGYRTRSNIWMRRNDGSEFQVALTSTDEVDGDGTVVGRTVDLKPT